MLRVTDSARAMVDTCVVENQCCVEGGGVLYLIAAQNRYIFLVSRHHSPQHNDLITFGMLDKVVP